VKRDPRIYEIKIVLRRKKNLARSRMIKGSTISLRSREHGRYKAEEILVLLNKIKMDK
jgi:hypothetical protein